MVLLMIDAPLSIEAVIPLSHLFFSVGRIPTGSSWQRLLTVFSTVFSEGRYGLLKKTVRQSGACDGLFQIRASAGHRSRGHSRQTHGRAGDWPQ
jgi:hypothetical protein